ncbi:MAG: hypothetical protein JWM27_3538 [Gemmatimonadetes bacterium]|nr:hypothetical protein [Gemmatimonadota bacterium]
MGGITGLVVGFIFSTQHGSSRHDIRKSVPLWGVGVVLGIAAGAGLGAGWGSHGVETWKHVGIPVPNAPAQPATPAPPAGDGVGGGA